MDKVELTKEDVTALLDWRDAHKDFVRSMVKSGASYAKLTEVFGISQSTIPEWKRKLNLPLDLNVGHRHSRYYTVYRRNDDSIVCHGYVEDCMKALGMTRSNFYSMVSRSLHGRNGKYEVDVATIHEGEEENEQNVLR